MSLPGLAVRPWARPAVTPRAPSVGLTFREVPVFDPSTKALLISDSLGEGFNASSIDKRYQSILTARMGGTGLGFLPACYSSSTIGFPEPTLAGAVTKRTQSGFGFRNVEIAAGGTVTWPTVTIIGDTLRVWYSTAPFSASLSVTIDGVLAATIPTASVVASRHDEYTDVTVAPGVHSVVFGRTGLGTANPFLNGIHPDVNLGPFIIDACRGGAGTTFFSGGRTGGFGTVSDLADWTPDVDAAILTPGINDCGSPIVHVNTATFASQYVEILDGLLDGNADLKLCLVAMYAPAAPVDEPWAAYVEVIAALAATYNARLIDFTADDAPTVAKSDPVHPSDSGHTQIADYMEPTIATMLAPPVGRITLGGTPERPAIGFDPSAVSGLSVVSAEGEGYYRLTESGAIRQTETGDLRELEAA